METEVELNVECEGRLLRGRPSKFDSFHGNWIPADHPEIENFRVYLCEPGRDRLEITSFLSENTRKRLYSDYLDSMLEEQ